MLLVFIIGRDGKFNTVNTVFITTKGSILKKRCKKPLHTGCEGVLFFGSGDGKPQFEGII